MRAEYDSWAVYYDWIHQGLPGEADYYLREGLARPGPILELGVGTGRIALPLAAAGQQVIGLDLSRGMLAVCAEKQRLAPKLRGSLWLVQGDMRRFAFGCSFPTILMPYRTFMHLLSPEDQIACLRRIKMHLAPEGRLVLNLWTAPDHASALLLKPGPRRFRLVGEHPVSGEGIVLRHFYRGSTVEHAQLLLEQHRVEEVDEHRRVLRRTLLHMQRRWISPRAMQRLVARCGFQIERLEGGFRGEAFGAAGQEMVLVLRRQDAGRRLQV